jgi:hypothetical protein
MFTLQTSFKPLLLKEGGVVNSIVEVTVNRKVETLKTFVPIQPLFIQGVTKRCRLSWLTTRALVCEPKCGEMGVAGSHSANEYIKAHGAQINFGDLTPHLAMCVSLTLNVCTRTVYMFIAIYNITHLEVSL